MRGNRTIGQNYKRTKRRKYCENCEKLHLKHFIGCQGVKLLLLKDDTVTNVTTATVTTVTITNVRV